MDDIHFMMEAEQDDEVLVDSGHGRIETRCVTAVTELDWLQHAHQWPGLTAVGRITRRRELASSITNETTYTC